MTKLLLTLFIILALVSQVTAVNFIRTHEAPSTVISAMLSENYMVMIASLILLIATLI
jgi:hypothetical protein